MNQNAEPRDVLKKLPRRTASSDGEEPCDEADDLTTRKSGNEKLKIWRSEVERELKKMKAARLSQREKTK